MRLQPIFQTNSVLLSLLHSVAAAQNPIWYTVESEVLICEPVASVGFRVTLPLTAPKKDTPHVLTFFRTSNNSVTVTFEVRDADKKIVVKNQTVTFQALTAKRRLLENSSSPAEHFMAKFEEPEVEDAQEDEWGMETWRRLSARRRGGGVTSSSSSKTSSSTSSSKTSSSTGGLRRRANPAAARRRGSATEGKNQPSAGVGGSRFQNSNGQSWAYTSQSRLTSNYGGRTPQTTSYGYSGQSAYTSPTSGRSNMAMYAGAGLVGGVAVGAGAMYLMSSSSYGSYSRYGRGNDRCSHSSGWSGSCSACFQRYKNEECIQDGPRGSANRDDLMNTGFWPADWKSPLTVTIFSVSGVDFERSRICPPAGWTEHDGSEVLPAGSDIFLTMTEMAELGDALEADGSAGAAAAVAGSLISICCCCCCLCAIVAICFKLAQSTQRVGDSSSDSQRLAHDQPVIVEASVVQPYSSVDDQAVVMGSPVFQQPYQAGRPVG